MPMLVGRRPCTAAEAIRHRENLAETLQIFLTANPPDQFHQLARENHARWASKAEDSPACIEVQIRAGDWDEVTLELSRRYGQIFVVAQHGQCLCT